MPEWQFHEHAASDEILSYRCGLTAGQRVALRKNSIVRDYYGAPTGEIHSKGEVWIVLPGTKTDPVLWFRLPDGSRRTWDDDAALISEWFELV